MPPRVLKLIDGSVAAATARILGATLATRDEKLIAYARQRHLVVC